MKRISLGMEQRLQIIDWLRAHKDVLENKTIDSFIDRCKNDLGIETTETIMRKLVELVDITVGRRINQHNANTQIARHAQMFAEAIEKIYELAGESENLNPEIQALARKTTSKETTQNE